jgi:hypothetical protein
MAKAAQLFDVTAAQKEQADAAIRERQREIAYDQRDFTIELIIQKFRDDEFFVPAYQRAFIWTERDKSSFIESVLLGLPIPFMFVADMPDGRLEIVDGAQRIQTLEAFLADDLVLSKLEELPALNDFRFSDLPVAQQRKLKNRALRLVVLEETTTEEIRQAIFTRINKHGRRATPAEIRRGALQGPFMTLVKELASDSLFRKLCPMSDKVRKNRRDEELVVRFFAYSDRYLKFQHDVDAFLNRYVKEHRHLREQSRLREEFQRMLNFVNRYFPSGFAKSPGATSTPRVRFEAIAVGSNLALRRNPQLVPVDMSWLDSPEFQFHTTTHASNSLPRLRGRIEYVRDRLLAENN